MICHLVISIFQSCKSCKMATVLKVLALFVCCSSDAVLAIQVTDVVATTLTPAIINTTYTAMLPQVAVARSPSHILFIDTINRPLISNDYFTQILWGDFIGARNCETTTDCGSGLKCDRILLAQGARYHCWNGACHFSGPRHCKTNADCMSGFPGLNWDCADTKDLERAWMKAQLLNRTKLVPELKPERNRDPRKNKDKPHNEHDDHSGELESAEWTTMGLPEGDFLTNGH